MSIAFFDIDGTLLPRPSLERRFFRELRWQGKIPVRNYLAWITEAVRFGFRDFRSAAQANKTYLRGIAADVFSPALASRRAAWLPNFLPAAVQRVWWHALRGDSIVLVSGTLQPLAQMIQFALERELLWRGVDAEIFFLATALEVRDDKFTGRVTGDPMFAQQKAAAIKAYADSRGISLASCSAYGDSSLDRWMLAAVGQPFAVNPTRRLKSVANLRGWRVLAWSRSSLRGADEPRRSSSELKLAILKRKAGEAR